MKKPKIIIFIVFIIGLILLLFPICSNLVSKINQEKLINEYIEQIENMSAEEKQKTLDNYNNYNNSLNITAITEDEEINTSYIDFFQVGNILGYIEIPKINIYLPIFEGTTDEVLAKGIGHLENTSLPIGGLSSHSVLAGHTGYTNSKFFDDIDKLEIGDTFSIYIYDEKLDYEINQIKIVDPDDTNDVQIEEDKDYITLVTCTPQIFNTLRLLVRGERVYSLNIEEQNAEEINILDTSVQENKNTSIFINTTIIKTIIVILVISIILISFLICFFKLKKRRK